MSAARTTAPLQGGHRHVSGASSSAGMHTHTPWYHVLQSSHWMLKSSASIVPAYPLRSKQFGTQSTSLSLPANSLVSGT
jgi:hypothetical protein